MTAADSIRFKKFIPAIVWFLVVLVLVCTPGDDLPKVDNWFEKIYGDKMIHVGVFAIMAYLFFLPVARSSWPKEIKLQYLLKIAVATCIWGLTTEFIQRFFVPGRSFDLRDWLADSIGAAVAYIWGRWKMV